MNLDFIWIYVSLIACFCNTFMFSDAFMFTCSCQSCMMRPCSRYTHQPFMDHLAFYKASSELRARTCTSATSANCASNIYKRCDVGFPKCNEKRCRHRGCASEKSGMICILSKQAKCWAQFCVIMWWHVTTAVEVAGASRALLVAHGASDLVTWWCKAPSDVHVLEGSSDVTLSELIELRYTASSRSSKRQKVGEVRWCVPAKVCTHS